MASGLLQQARALLLPVGMSGLSARSQAELLSMSFTRLRFSVYMIPLVALPLVTYFGLRAEAAGMLVWGLSYVMLAFVVRKLARRYTDDQCRLPPETMVKRWLPRVQNIAWLHGAGLAASVIAMAPEAPQEFRMLLVLVIAHIISTNATHQTPTIGVFLRFFASSWHVMILMAYWIFPDLWQSVVPLSLIYSLVIYRHALTSHRFAIEQVQLKELSERLAEQFRAAKEQAEAALQEKNLFLTTASHDLRQPIHAMSMLVEAITHRNKDAEAAPLLADLKLNMSSMNQMFNALLDLSRLEAGKPSERSVPVRLAELLQGIVTLFREQAHQRGLTLRLRVPTGHATVWTDAATLRQAVVNLVHNALRYTKQGGILIGLRQRGPDWQIEVWDTGVGIAAEEGQQIFSPYYRNQHAWRIDSAGHGLGLAVVARCAHLIGAKLQFRSSLGKGSRFWLRLPAYRETAAESMATLPNGGNPRAELHSLSGSCLVLDDDPQVIAAWRVLLDAWGVTGCYATNATEALQHLAAGFVPDAVFCDQRLRSGESGFEILRAVLDRYPEACGAMVSGEFNSSELIDAEAEGFMVLHKPLDTAQLYAVLSRWLAHNQPDKRPVARTVGQL